MSDVTVEALVLLYHTAPVEKIEHALAAESAEAPGKWLVVEEASELTGEIGGLASTEEKASIAKNFGKGTEIGRDDGQTTKHVLRHDKTKDFATERRHDDNGRLSECGFELRVW
jgi:hypothetical protein